ncbi:hypothetical protein N1851_033363 [Merluccius polli]|uniref:Alkylated DNA repair protein AlkB homologue 8 N-terminal domain-containing protein n=1 Tax=Merluccius polli TaxID=89951 RepID=A0AA47M1B8_MERPO|nr:hypothetical protein N1851_033363 [Merluccius polli]
MGERTSLGLPTPTTVKKAQQRLHFLRILRKHHLEEKLLLSFYRCSIESVLAYCISTSYTSCSAADKKALLRIINTAQKNHRLCPAFPAGHLQFPLSHQICKHFERPLTPRSTQRLVRVSAEESSTEHEGVEPGGEQRGVLAVGVHSPLYLEIMELDWDWPEEAALSWEKPL